VGILTLLGSSMDQLDILYFQECDYGMVWYGMVWYGMVWYMVWYRLHWIKNEKGSLYLHFECSEI